MDKKADLVETTLFITDSFSQEVYLIYLTAHYGPRCVFLLLAVHFTDKMNNGVNVCLSVL